MALDMESNPDLQSKGLSGKISIPDVNHLESGVHSEMRTPLRIKADLNSECLNQ